MSTIMVNILINIFPEKMLPKADIVPQSCVRKYDFYSIYLKLFKIMYDILGTWVKFVTNKMIQNNFKNFV